MALSCHMAMDILARSEGCVLGELKVAELTSFAVLQARAAPCGIVTAKKPFSQHGRVTLKVGMC